MKRIRQPVPYLRLAASQQDAASSLAKSKLKAKRAPREPQQLAFPYPDPFMVVIANVGDMQTSKFISLLESISPKWVVDARATPRLDQLAGTRTRAFKLFDEYGLEYIDLGLGTYASAKANPALWVDWVGKTIQSSLQPLGPFLILFDNIALMNASTEVLPSALKQNLGHEISFSVIE